MIDMRKFRLAVIAGTSDATDFISSLADECEITAFTATEYGREILKGIKCEVHCGRLDEKAFKTALLGFDAVADISHPFAVEVTKTVKKASEYLKIPYIRIGRQTINYNYEKIKYVDSKEKASELLSETEGNILFTTGANTINYYESTVMNFSERAFVRVLDNDESRKNTVNSKAVYIYAIPPFTVEDTEKLIQKYDISILVSKDSGERGRVPEKIEASRKYRIDVIIIKSPEKKDFFTISQAVEKIRQIKEQRNAE